MNGPIGSFKDLAINLDPRKITWENKGRDLVFILLILVTICIFFWKVVLNPDGLLFSNNSDIVEQYYPWRSLSEDSLENGDLPLWNPYNFGGEPLLANIQLGFFYPPNLLLFWLLPANTAFGIGFILHYFIGGASLYLVCRRMGLASSHSYLSSIIFLFSGYMVGHTFAGHYVQVCAATWLPMVFLLMDITMEKKSLLWGSLLGVIIGFQFLAGHIQISIFSIIIMLGLYGNHLWVKRRILKGNKEWTRQITAPLAGGVVAILISLIQLVLTLQYTSESTREGGMSYSWATSYSLPPQNILGFLLPNLFGNPVAENYWNMWNYWEMAVYIGIPTLVLIFFAMEYRRERYVKFMIGLGIFSLTMALGRYTPLYWVFFKIVPYFDILRVPSRFILITILCGSILAGFGARSLMEKLSKERLRKISRTSKVMMGLTGIALILAIVLLVSKPAISDAVEEILPDIISDEGALSTAFSKVSTSIEMAIMDIITMSVFITATIGLLVWRIKRKQDTDRIMVALVLLTLVNLGWYHMRFIDVKDLDEIYVDEDYVVFLQENSKGYRIYDPQEIILDNSQIVFGIESLDGYNPLELRYFNDLVERIHDLSNNLHHPVLNMLNVKYILTKDRLVGSGFEPVFNSSDSSGVRIYENPMVLPRTFTVGNHYIFSEDEILERIGGGDFHPSEAAFLENEPKIHYPKFGRGAPSPYNRTEIVKVGSNEVEVWVNLTSTGFLVLSQSYYSAWVVEVDGEDTTIQRVNHGLCGIYLYQGHSKVRFYIDGPF